MKFIFYVLMIPLAFVLGKVLYSPLFEGGEPVDTTPDSVVEIKVFSKMGTVTERIDLHDIAPEDYPDKVTLAETTVLTDKNGLSPLPLDPGSPVKPLELTEMMLKVTSPLATHLTGEVSVFDTDFAEGVAQKRMERRHAAMAEAEGSGGSKPTEATMTKPEVASNTTKPDADMGGESSGEPAEEPKPAAEPETPSSLNEEQIVAAMKESLEGGKVKELDVAKVTNWESAGEESFDGVDFQVGIATYKEMTILGEKTLQAKALFKNGKLDKWIHSKTGMQIR